MTFPPKKSIQNNKLTLEDYDSSVNAGYKSVEVYLARAEHKCELMQMCAEAVKDFDLALDLNPGNVEISQKRTVAKYRSGDVQAAIADYLKIVNKADPNSKRNLSFIKTREEVYDTPAIASDIANAIAEPFSKKVNQFREEDKSQEAIAELTKAVNLFPDNYVLHLRRADLARFTNNADLVETDSLKMVSLKPFDFETKRRAIHYLMGVGRCNTALEIMNASVFETPANPESYLWRGNVKNCLEDFEGALEDNDKAISLDPSNELYKANRANI